MNLQNPIQNLYAAIASGFIESFSVVAKTLAKLVQPERRRIEEPQVLSPRAGGQTSPTPSVAEPSPASPSDCGEVPAPVVASEPAAPPAAKKNPAVKARPQAERPSRRRSPTLAADPELTAIQSRVASMEKRVLDLETQKAEMEQLLDEYAFCQYQALGELLGEQLRLQHQILQLRAERSSSLEDRQAADAAGEEYQAYQQAHDNPATPPAALADDERDELRALYRAAAMRCHPDRVGEAEKALAHEMFLRTQDAYRRRDLEAMRLISRQLAAASTPSSPISDGSTPRERLEVLLESLLDKGAGLLLAIQSIQMQAQYRRARHREQWEDYFAAARQQLEAECAALRQQLVAYV
ncbi:MAG TPA: molecular chaperone DnaJ [Azonexus sp.]|nr:molecular chaperone DnaJ [Azonexus sp.]